jgi:ABC-type glycerol-3-phosphate transport system permease component
MKKIGVAASLAILALMAYGLSTLPHWVVLVWAILSTIALPLSVAVAWWLGRYEAKATLKGFELGLSKRPTVRVLPDSQFCLPPMMHEQVVNGEVIEL